MVRKVLDEKPITLRQVYELLKIREETGINYVQRVTAQHAEKLSRDAAFSEEAVKTIQEEFDLPRILVVQILNINPKTPIDVRAITGDRLSNDQVDQLLTHYSEHVSVAATEAAVDKEISDEEEEDDEEGFEDL